MSATTLACCAFPLGYGPAAKLLLIAEVVRRAGLRAVFVGNGIAHELAARADVFEDVIRADPADKRARSLIASSAGMLSLMERDFAEIALALSVPLHVVDSLFWMRERVPAPFRGARRYWVQRFPAAPGTTAPANTVAVGPIVRAMEPSDVHERTKLVVNLGGCESPNGPAEDLAYADFVVRGLLECELVSAFAGAILLGGSRCVRHLRETFGHGGIVFESVAHEEALTLLRQARMVLTSPGLTTSLECCQLAVPTFFLPPQNWSQWRILDRFRALGLAPGSFHWQDCNPEQQSLERLPEASRTPRVGECIRRAAGEGETARTYRARLAECLSVDGPALARAQRAFFDSLGPNGVEQIVGDLVSLYRNG